MYEALLEKSHNQVLEARNVEYLLKSSEFKDCWNTASQEQQDLLLQKEYISLEFLRDWMDDKTRKISSRELKSIAKRLGIPNYSRLSSLELKQKIMEIYESHTSNTNNT